jgi:hypothetical protein
MYQGARSASKDGIAGARLSEGCTRLLPCNICTLTTAAHNSDSKSSHAFHFLATAHLATQTSGKEGEGFQKLLLSSGHICRENGMRANSCCHYCVQQLSACRYYREAVVCNLQRAELPQYRLCLRYERPDTW